MYPNYLPQYYNYPTSQEDYLYSTPYQVENYYHSIPGDRQFGGFQPPFAPPGQGPMGGPPTSPPPFAPPGQGSEAGPPTSPPPSFVPQQQASAYAVDPGGIRGCLFRYTYVWLRGFEQFWFYPTHVGRNSVSGYRWTGFRWVYFGIDLRQIQSFTCF
ncbi:hypothetical protein V7139_07120 [Neobacillus drentensis]|uniref:hypothetical protein n=1 Tax=Neobacillus drentensis TaxID=220684 RepID=UPI002FFF4BBD